CARGPGISAVLPVDSW
nr:immunoglobulin heavy chain junction region [Macaca mulatta]